MKSYSQLGTIDRGAPCQEYPGAWVVYLPLPYEGKMEHTFSSLEDAKLAGLNILNDYEDCGLEYDPRHISIAWVSSYNDPRIGHFWFTSFYIHGRFNIWGNYEEI